MFIFQFLFWLSILVFTLIFALMNMGTVVDIWVLPGKTLKDISLPIAILSIFLVGWGFGFFLPILGRYFKQKDETEELIEEEEDEE